MILLFLFRKQYFNTKICLLNNTQLNKKNRMKQKVTANKKWARVIEKFASFIKNHKRNV